MIAKECDRCGQLYRKPKKWPDFQVHWQHHEGGQKKGKWFDLCPDCQRELEDWLALASFPEEGDEEYETA